MKQTITLHGLTMKLWTTVAALAAMVAVLVQPTPVSAHCDSTNGPVVGAAREALKAGDPGPVLAYVRPDAEAELRAAFWQTLEVRQAGGQAQELADRAFFETAVRLHRVGEGAPYTGLQEIGDVGPALTAAERALETGDVDAVSTVIDRAVRLELDEKYQAVLAARERTAHDGSVAANRERVEAELAFETYVDKLYQAALGRVEHGTENVAQAEAH